MGSRVRRTSPSPGSMAPGRMTCSVAVALLMSPAVAAASGLIRLFSSTGSTVRSASDCSGVAARASSVTASEPSTCGM